MNKEEYAIFPGQIKINNCTYFGLDYELTDFVNHLAEQNQKYKEVIDKVKEWEQTHTILVYTKEAPRQLVGTHELLHILYDKEVK